MQKLFKLHCILEHKLKANQKKNQTFCDITKKKIIVMVESSFILFWVLENRILNITPNFSIGSKKNKEKQRKFTLPNLKSFFIGSLTCSICTWIHFTFVWCPFSRLIWTIFKSFLIICSLFLSLLFPKS